MASGDGATEPLAGVSPGVFSVLLKFACSFFKFNMVAVLASSYLVASIESSFYDQ